MRDHELTLTEMLAKNAQKDIVRNANLLKISVSKYEKKTKAAKLVADFILNEPLALLRHLPEKDVLKLQRMVHSPNNEVPINSLSHQNDCIARIGLSDFNYTEERNIEFIYSDLAEALTPVIDDYVNAREERAATQQHEQLILGLLNLYGMLTLRQLVDLFKEYDTQTSEFELFETMYNSYLLHSTEVKAPNGFVYVSPFMEDIDSAMKKMKDLKLTMAEFTLDEVIAAGDSEFPMPPSSIFIKEYYSILYCIYPTKEEMDQWVSFIWTGDNYITDFGKIISLIFFPKPEPDQPKLDKEQIKFSNSYLRATLSLIAFLPKWRLKGHSPYEIYQKKISHLPPEISLEAPCPCGSGKKYKNCCGNN
ncbi:SEC-C domain-containing protein [uncultured Bacteroides sp.]|uniref:YecA family protein n=1 Tax=uncultured Bacteroides sp. TaxID=162156 RepID=UPI002AA73E53|nr:SEC-C domain-containing protein [uncultured Bacteroides sp.]